MAFETERVSGIITQLTSASVEERLRAIEEAQDLNKNIFAGELSDSDWAYRAMVIENQYNLIRDILRENFKKLSPAQMSEAIAQGEKKEKKTKAAAKKAKVPLNQDPNFLKMMKEMFQPNKAEESNG